MAALSYPRTPHWDEHVLTVSMRENDYDEMREYARFMVAEYRLPENQLQISGADFRNCKR